MDQSSFAAPHGLSQRITSFIACACQGIHQLPLRHLIVLIANAHPYLGSANLSSSLALRGVLNLAIRASCTCRTRRPVPLQGTGQPKARLPFTTGHLRCHRRVRSGHFIGATPSSSLVPDHKTSFSRSVRGCAVRQHPSTGRQTKVKTFEQRSRSE